MSSTHNSDEIDPLESALENLSAKYAKKGDIPLRQYPDRKVIEQVTRSLLDLLFAEYRVDSIKSYQDIAVYIRKTGAEVFQLLGQQMQFADYHRKPGEHVPPPYIPISSLHSYAMKLFDSLLEIRQKLTEDIRAAYTGDPAARGMDDIVLSYPTYTAVATYRLAHELQVLKVPFIPRMMTEYAHRETGIDIHPGARIGRSFFIDHGTGVVIGETADVGNRVKLYQGVTLGAAQFPKNEKGELIRGQKRHPTLEDDVVVYANATILGGDTVIGKGSVIGANVFLTESVPQNSLVTMKKPELNVRKRRE